MPLAQVNRSEYEKRFPKSIFKIFTQKILHMIARFMIHPGLRVKIYRAMGINIGRNVQIMLDCYLDDQFPELITIEDDVAIGPRANFTVVDDSKWIVAPIIVRKGAYIGTGTIILPGCIIGKNSLVGAGSVVTKDVPPNCVAVGVPARVIKKSMGPGYKGPKGGIIRRKLWI